MSNWMWQVGMKDERLLDAKGAVTTVYNVIAVDLVAAVSKAQRLAKESDTVAVYAKMLMRVDS